MFNGLSELEPPNPTDNHDVPQLNQHGMKALMASDNHNIEFIWFFFVSYVNPNL